MSVQNDEKIVNRVAEAICRISDYVLDTVWCEKAAREVLHILEQYQATDKKTEG